MRRSAALLGLVLWCAGCATPDGLSDVMQRPAERALLAGMRHYDDGQYPEAERELKRSLDIGLSSPRDRANAHKHLAFIYCTSNRAPACEKAFCNALSADSLFALGKAEAGHPQWGPVYRRVTGSRRACTQARSRSHPPRAALRAAVRH